MKLSSIKILNREERNIKKLIINFSNHFILILGLIAIPILEWQLYAIPYGWSGGTVAATVATMSGLISVWACNKKYLWPATIFGIICTSLWIYLSIWVWGDMAGNIGFIVMQITSLSIGLFSFINWYIAKRNIKNTKLVTFSNRVIKNRTLNIVWISCLTITIFVINLWMSDWHATAYNTLDSLAAGVAKAGAFMMAIRSPWAFFLFFGADVIWIAKWATVQPMNGESLALILCNTAYALFAVVVWFEWNLTKDGTVKNN